MKKIPRKLGLMAVLGLSLSFSALAGAQTTSSTTTSTTSEGTVNSYGSNQMTVTGSSSTTPSRYSYSKTTTYTDESGNPVPSDTIRSGVPVTVYYNQDGSNMTATRVIVHKSTTSGPDGVSSSEESHKTTTTTTTGQ